MNDFYVAFTAEGTANGRTNEPADFSVPVPWLGTLRGRYEFALVEISLECDFSPKADRLYLCCDAAEATFINARRIQLVRNVETRGRYKKYLTETYQDARYVQILPWEREYFRFYCLGADLKPVTFAPGTLHCVLHVRKTTERT